MSFLDKAKEKASQLTQQAKGKYDDVKDSKKPQASGNMRKIATKAMAGSTKRTAMRCSDRFAKVVSNGKWAALFSGGPSKVWVAYWRAALATTSNAAAASATVVSPFSNNWLWR